MWQPYLRVSEKCSQAIHIGPLQSAGRGARWRGPQDGAARPVTEKDPLVPAEEKRQPALRNGSA